MWAGIAVEGRFSVRLATGRFSPDSAVAIDKKREAQPFRSEVDGFLPLSRHRSAVLREDVEPHSNDVRKRKMTLKLHSRTPSLLQDSTALPATAESGFSAPTVSCFTDAVNPTARVESGIK